MSAATISRPEREAQARRRTALACAGLVAGMAGAAYASVPLYNLFCRLTGYDGTPLVGTTAPSTTSARSVTVRFDANVAPGLGWTFGSTDRAVEARLGETQTVFFRVRNEGSRPTTGVSTYNVSPGQVGAYFVKLKCFCFEEQTLKPGEEMDFPVVFYVDPAMAKDASLADLSAITLSYTYFPSRNGQPVASVDAARPKL